MPSFSISESAMLAPEPFVRFVATWNCGVYETVNSAISSIADAMPDGQELVIMEIGKFGIPVGFCMRPQTDEAVQLPASPEDHVHPCDAALLEILRRFDLLDAKDALAKHGFNKWRRVRDMTEEDVEKLKLPTGIERDVRTILLGSLKTFKKHHEVMEE